MRAATAHSVGQDVLPYFAVDLYPLILEPDNPANFAILKYPSIYYPLCIFTNATEAASYQFPFCSIIKDSKGHTRFTYTQDARGLGSS